MQCLYDFFIQLFGLGIRLAGCRSVKAKALAQGHKHWKEELQTFAVQQKAPVIWFHVASLGEYEQGIQLMESIREHYPSYKILLTFFSPSGYEHCKNNSLADKVCYLPLDTKGNAREFLKILRPKVAIFIKYEFWYNFLKELALEHIPVYFVAVRFRPKQYFFRFYGSWFVGHLKTVSGFFVQNEISKQCLYKVGINQVWVSGDTRFDRVLKIKESKEDFPWIASFAQQKRLIIAGSSWPNDEKLLKLYLEKQGLDCRLILVPHEIHLSRLDAVLKEFQSLGAVLYSSVKKGEIDASHFERVKVLIIDEVGILSKIYRYADIAYIGGGFGKGIHNVLEAAVYGIPVLFGPNYGKFGEALDLISCGGAFSVANEEELEYRLNSLKDPSLWKISSAKAEEYVSSHDGAVEIVLKQMSSEL